MTSDKEKVTKHRLKIETGTMTEVRNSLGKFASLAAWGNTCIVLTKSGKPMAAIVPLSVLPEVAEAVADGANGVVLEIIE